MINVAVPFERLEDEVRGLAGRLASVPLSQLAAMKLVVNQAYENMGLANTQMLGPILDGLMRNTPDAREWIELAAEGGRRRGDRGTRRPVRATTARRRPSSGRIPAT